jgi:hypothetical protein
MKLVPTTQKVQIKWFVYSMGHKLPKTASMRGAWDGYDFACSCGYESRTGGAIKSCVTDIMEKHKRIEHDYEWQLSNLPVELYATSILGEAK